MISKAQIPNYFDPSLILEDLSPHDKIQFSHILEGRDRFNHAFAEIFAKKLKAWAKQKGATHYNYWFHPSACLASQGPEADVSWKCDSIDIENLSGSALFNAKGDISPFSIHDLPPHLISNGLLSLDICSRPFVLEGPAQSFILWIPSLFSSSNGDSLDLKIPLLRSIEKLNASVSRLLKICRVPLHELVPCLKIKNKFYIIDRKLVNEFSCFEFKGTDVLSRHLGFSGSQCDAMEWTRRVNSYIREVEEVSASIGHEINISEVGEKRLLYEAIAKSQKIALAIDGNALLMQIMHQIGVKHDVVPLFFEKPFSPLTSSEKNLEWSLFNPDGSTLNHLVLLVLLSAMMNAIYVHQDLFKASISYMSLNRWFENPRGLSAPLTIDLGKTFSQVLDRLLSEAPLELREIGLASFDKQSHQTELFSGSFCRFSKGGFEFSNLSTFVDPSFAVCVIQSVLADSLHLLLDEMVDEIEKSSGRSLFDCIAIVLRKHLKEAVDLVLIEKGKGVHSKTCFSTSLFDPLINQRSIRAFEGVFSSEGLENLRSIYLERYVRSIEKEASQMSHYFRMKILPELNASSKEKHLEHSLQMNIEQAIIILAEIDKLNEQMLDFGVEARAKVYSEIGLDKITKARNLVDQLENYCQTF